MTRAAAVLAWAIDTFGSIAADRHERARRFLEEAIELAQAEGIDRDVAEKIVARCYSRPPGSVGKEIGQCMVTLECLAQNLGMDASLEADKEFDRVSYIPKSEHQARHAAKVALGIAESI